MRKIILAGIYIYYLTGPVLFFGTLLIGKPSTLFYSLICASVAITAIPFMFKKQIGTVAYKALIELGNDESINLSTLARKTKSYSITFLGTDDFDALDKKVKSNLRKKNKWQGHVSTSNFYDYA